LYALCKKGAYQPLSFLIEIVGCKTLDYSLSSFNVKVSLYTLFDPHSMKFIDVGEQKKYEKETDEPRNATQSNCGMQQVMSGKPKQREVCV